MPTKPNTSWLARRLQKALGKSLGRAYTRVKVDQDHYLERLRNTHSLPIRSFDDMFHLPQETVDHLADQAITAARRIAVLEGAGLGMGGMLTFVPDMGILSAIVIRMIQKLSLIYGFTYSSDEEVATLWLAAASAAGLDLGKEFIEKEAVQRLVPRIVERIAVKMSAEMAEKWAGRLVPVVSGAIGAALNYYFIREWGRRAKEHFREKHRLMRAQVAFPSRRDSLQLPPSIHS